jgi:S-adenosylmethionine-diacylgycerolhomoserine-N-methlytransferase
MIPGWPGVVERALEHLRPGGALAIVDFGDQRDLPDWFRRALTGWLALFGVEPRHDMTEVLSRMARERGVALAVEPRFGGYAMHATYVAPPSAGD